MTSITFRLILLVSCAHGLVHVFELALPSVEQMIGEEFDVGQERTGVLGTVWRLPFGIAALLAGWLADRFGSKPLLLIYLAGCMATALLAYWSTSLNMLFVVMFAMGCFASIYHPAGLAIISRETTPENRGAALGWHGIFGSIGIASAPFLAGMVFSTGRVSWREYYALLVIPAAVLAVLIAILLKEHRRQPIQPRQVRDENLSTEDDAHWRKYFVLVVVGAFMGFIYASFMHFLPRYLDTAGIKPVGMVPASIRNLLTAVVLLFGVAGQALAGKLARPGRLEVLLATILFANVPPLVWMAIAEGRQRLWATCTLALVHFMSQPVYNSLIAQYVPRKRRSLSYGFSNMLTFGIGGLGPLCAGFVREEYGEHWTYGGLAVIAAVAGLLAFVLWRSAHTKRDG